MEQIRYTEKQNSMLLRIKSKTIDSCKKCGGEGFVKGAECSCRQVFRWCAALVFANIPKTYWNLDIDDLKIVQVVKNIVVEYMNNFDTAFEEGLGFVFSGEWGIGKTSLMCEIGKHALMEGKKVFYCLADDYVKSIIKPTILNTTKGIEEFDMILLDELDKVYIKSGSDYSVKEIEKLFRNTLPFNKIVIVGTNAIEEELLELFGDSVVSIMKRHLKFVEFEGEDHSKKLQDGWLKKLREDNINYISDNILKQAKVYCSKNKI